MSMFSIAVHGGASVIPRERLSQAQEAAFLEGLKEALESGSRILAAGGSALDAVETAVCALEDNPLFNAARGAVFTAKGEHELDAAIMDGASLMAGAVAGVKGVKNPIRLARLVPERSPHLMLCGEGALEFAQLQGCELAGPDYFFDEYRHQQWLRVKGRDSIHLDHTEDLAAEGKLGTVGAVACDRHGNIAAATSTGGMTNKRFGRIGDSPLIGAGTYANNKACAVSCTGHGEPFIRAVAAYDLACLVMYKGMALSEAAAYLVKVKLKDMQADGGLIAVDAQGNLALPFNTEGMYRAWMKAGEAVNAAIY